MTEATKKKIEAMAEHYAISLVSVTYVPDNKKKNLAFGYVGGATPWAEWCEMHVNQLEQGIEFMKQGKKQFAPHTTNSFVDEWIKDSEYKLKEYRQWLNSDKIENIHKVIRDMDGKETRNEEEI